MKKTRIPLYMIILLAAASLAYCLVNAADILCPQAQEKEKRLLQGLAPEQVQAIGRNAALFEKLPNPGTNPVAALEGILAGPGIQGMAKRDATFVVMALAGRHLDMDLKEVAGGIADLTASRQLLQAACAKFNGSAAGTGLQPGGANGNAAKGPPGGKQTGAPDLMAGPGGRAPTLAAQEVQTAFYGIAYWKVAPLSIRSLEGLSNQERLAEAALLRTKLSELDGLLAQMTERLAYGKLRRSQFVQALNGMASRATDASEK